MAARAGQADVVRYLLQNGAKVDIKAKVRHALMLKFQYISFHLTHLYNISTVIMYELIVSHLSTFRMTKRPCI